MERIERASRGMRTALIIAAPVLWVAALTVAAGDWDHDGRIPTILTIMALAGTMLGAMRERDERTIGTLGRELADATRPGHHDHRHLHRVPGGQ